MRSAFLWLASFGLTALACGGSFVTGDSAPDGGSGRGSGSGGLHSNAGGSGGAGGSNTGSGGDGASGGQNGSGGVASNTGGDGNGGIASTGGTVGAGGVAGSGGIIAAGGVVSSGGTSSSGGTVGSSCPPTLPAQGAPCGPDPLQCSYGTCCPTAALCQSGAWNIVYPPCSSGCPSTAPQNGSTCPCQLDGKTCDYDSCSSGGTHTQATCTGGAWQNKALPCSFDPCGGVACSNNTICMAVTSGTGSPTVNCVTNSCTGRSSNPCSCIGTACQTLGGTCSNLPSGTLCTVPAP